MNIDTKKMELLESIKEKLMGEKNKEFHFLLVGRTGVGKSSTVNSLLGKKVAEVGEYEPTTMDVKLFKSEIEGIRFTIIDTPGLCDDIDNDNDEKYLKMIKEKADKVDVVWFVTKLSETRVSSDEKRGIKLITESLTGKVWDNAIIVFTFANDVSKDRYEEAKEKRAELIRKEIVKYSGKAIHTNIPAVFVDNTSDFTPDGKPWLGELFVKVLTVIKQSGLTPFFMSMASSITPDSTGESRIVLDEKQKAETKKIIDAKIIPGLATIGAGIGSAFGPARAVIGGAVGAGIGLISWLFS